MSQRHARGAPEARQRRAPKERQRRARGAPEARQRHAARGTPRHAVPLSREGYDQQLVMKSLNPEARRASGAAMLVPEARQMPDARARGTRQWHARGTPEALDRGMRQRHVPLGGLGHYMSLAIVLANCRQFANKSCGGACLLHGSRRRAARTLSARAPVSLWSVCFRGLH